MDRRTYLGLVGAALAGCSGNGSGDGVVEMTDDLRFEPDLLRVEAGTTVEWRNVGSVKHSVTAYADRIPEGADYFASGGFDSEAAARDDVRGGLIGAGGSYEHTFDAAGRHEYFCIPHEGSGMTGTVRVG